MQTKWRSGLAGEHWGPVKWSFKPRHDCKFVCRPTGLWSKYYKFPPSPLTSPLYCSPIFWSIHTTSPPSSLRDFSFWKATAAPEWLSPRFTWRCSKLPFPFPFPYSTISRSSDGLGTCACNWVGWVGGYKDAFLPYFPFLVLSFW